MHMPTVTVCYFDDVTGERSSEREVANLCPETVEEVVEHFDGGIVFGVYHGARCLHRSAAQLSDLI